MNTTPHALALSAAVGSAGLAHASGNPFAMQGLAGGYQDAEFAPLCAPRNREG
ncbi:MAG: hypothetical protein HGA75_10215 [Thiobacillus sp.]|nr:hypothetical protein [Thiobacillus sp.]